jgi:hypothetical protein
MILGRSDLIMWKTPKKHRAPFGVGGRKGGGRTRREKEREREIERERERELERERKKRGNAMVLACL